jgi:hypothetical protein
VRARDQPEEADRAALLFSWWADRFRHFQRGHGTHAPPEFTLGFVPEGAPGAHLAVSLLRVALRIRVQLPDQDVPGRIQEFGIRACAPPDPGRISFLRWSQATLETQWGLGATGDTTGRVADGGGLAAHVRRCLDASGVPRDDAGEEWRVLFASVTSRTYEKILRLSAGEDRARARRDLAVLRPYLEAAHPALGPELRALLALE